MSVDRAAVITGSASGIGLALTRHLLDAGWRVHGIDRQPWPAGAHAGYTHHLRDLTDIPGISGLADALPARLRAFVHCAGVMRSGGVGDSRAEDTELRPAHEAGAAPGRQRGLGIAQAQQTAQQGRLPHGRIHLGRKAVQEKGVHAGRHTRDHLLDDAEGQGQRDRPGLELQPMQAGQQRRPLPGQFARQAAQGFGHLAFAQAAIGLPREGMPLDGQHVQTAAARRIVPPGLPERQEIGPQAEAGFAHRERLAPAPAPRQAIAVQEHCPRLAQRIGRAVIDIAVLPAEKAAVIVQIGKRGCQRDVSGRHGFAAIRPAGQECVGLKPRQKIKLS